MKKTNYGWVKFFSVLSPLIGIVFYFIEVDRNPKKASACLSGVIISIILSIVICLISLVVYLSPVNDYPEYYDYDIIEETEEPFVEDEQIENSLDEEVIQ